MHDFLDQAENLWRQKKLDAQYQGHFARVFEALGKLQSVEFKAHLDLDNLEAAFAAFEMAALLGHPATDDPDYWTTVLASIRILICETLLSTIRYPIVELGGGQVALVTPPKPYGDFADALRALTKGGRYGRCALLTFNYDLALDYALACQGLPVDYGLEEKPKKSYGIPLLKLHGSLNWVLDENEEPRVGKVKQRKLAPGSSSSHTSVRPIRDDFADYQGFRYNPSLHLPMIVPPTWNKSHNESFIRQVWARAATELQGAKRIVVIGYSLPETDLFFKYLFALGTISDTRRIHEFTVINPGGDVEARFFDLIGPHLRRCFRFHRVKFAEALRRRNKYLPSLLDSPSLN